MGERLEKKLKCQTRHPNFDDYWSKHSNLIWKVAHKLKRRFRNVEAGDIVGTLTIFFNRTLYSFDETKGCPFSTYFCNFALREVGNNFLRHESQANASWWRHGGEYVPTEYLRDAYTGEELYAAELVKQSTEQEILFEFGSDTDKWNELVKYLKSNERKVITQYYKYQFNGTQISKEMKITRQRFYQIKKTAEAKIKERFDCLVK